MIKFIFQEYSRLQLSDHFPDDGTSNVERQDEGRLLDLHPLGPSHTRGAAAGAHHRLLQAQLGVQRDSVVRCQCPIMRSVGEYSSQLNLYRLIVRIARWA